MMDIFVRLPQNGKRFLSIVANVSRPRSPLRLVAIMDPLVHIGGLSRYMAPIGQTQLQASVKAANRSRASANINTQMQSSVTSSF